MPSSGVTRAAENRKIRQDALRESLSKGSHVNDVIDIAKKLQDLGGTELDNTDVTRLKASADLKLKLIAKYIPDLKQTDIDMQVDGRVTLNRSVKRLDGTLPQDDDDE